MERTGRVGAGIAEINRMLSFGPADRRAYRALIEVLRGGVLLLVSILGTLLTAQVWVSCGYLTRGRPFFSLETHFGWLGWIVEEPEYRPMDGITAQIQLAVLGLTVLYAFLVLVLFLKRRNLALSTTVVVLAVLLWTVGISPFAPFAGWLGAYVVLLVAVAFCNAWQRRVGPWSFRATRDPGIVR